jgi:hypothetical protein
MARPGNRNFISVSSYLSQSARFVIRTEGIKSVEVTDNKNKKRTLFLGQMIPA